MASIWAKKPLSAYEADMKKSELKKVLGKWSLTAIGVGAIIGGGIFVLTGIAWCFCSLNVMLSLHLLSRLKDLHMHMLMELLAKFLHGPWDGVLFWNMLWQVWPWRYTENGFAMNLPAFIIVLLITALLVKGTKEAAKTNNLIVLLKTSAVVFVVIVGAFYVVPDNWIPFIPKETMLEQTNGEMASAYGFRGVVAGAAAIFFAYIGFDAVSTQAGEAINPKKDVPFAIITSLLICTVLYIAVSLVLTGMMHYTDFNPAGKFPDAIKAPVAYAFEICKGKPSEGMYSVDFYKDKFGIAVGGDYTAQKENQNNIATTTDGGVTWEIQASGKNGGYMTCVKIKPGSGGKEIIAVGDRYIGYSADYGKTWKIISEEKNLYVCEWLNENSRASEYVSEIAVEDPSYLAISKNGNYVYTVTEKADQQNSKAAGGGSTLSYNIYRWEHIVTANYMGGKYYGICNYNNEALGDASQEYCIFRNRKP
ncbi:hypothetical protein FQR65_LT18499 [Abscondita terminalis]|nr:hypothetical protein FQR65_LT18499 [Abscondita terminalis]